MKEFLDIALPKFSLLALFVKKPATLIAVIPSTIAVSQVVSYEGVWYLLVWFFLSDLVTGLFSCLMPDGKEGKTLTKQIF